MKPKQSNVGSEYFGDELNAQVNSHLPINRPVNNGTAAERAHNVWCDIDEALTPVIGARGVIALYKRSLRLAQAQHPCLAEVHDATHMPGDFFALRAVLLRQPDANSEEASGTLQSTFCDLLSKFIGVSLSKELLEPILEK